MSDSPSSLSPTPFSVLKPLGTVFTLLNPSNWDFKNSF
uniref:Uncharacterized protein n=1 Tax=Lotus japonicus TaxID=34305 RepID=I3S1F4_LOTJA|nr:unknown [Lotus japonicus]